MGKTNICRLCGRVYDNKIKYPYYVFNNAFEKEGIVTFNIQMKNNKEE